MKNPLALVALLSLAFTVGCSSTQTNVEAPTQTASIEEDDLDDLVVVLPTDGPPGTMNVDWEETEAQEAAKAKPRKNGAQPQLLSTRKRRLVVLPVKRTN